MINNPTQCLIYCSLNRALLMQALCSLQALKTQSLILRTAKISPEKVLVAALITSMQDMVKRLRTPSVTADEMVIPFDMHKLARSAKVSLYRIYFNKSVYKDWERL